MSNTFNQNIYFFFDEMLNLLIIMEKNSLYKMNLEIQNLCSLLLSLPNMGLKLLMHQSPLFS